jgi:hypothetical protein
MMRTSRLTAISLSGIFFLASVQAETVVNVTARKGVTRVYLPAGTIVVNFTPTIISDYHPDDGLAGSAGGAIQIVAQSDSGQQIVVANYIGLHGVELPGVQNLGIGTHPGGTTTFQNPAGQFYAFFERGIYTLASVHIRPTTGEFDTLSPGGGPTDVYAPPPPSRPTPGLSPTPISSPPGGSLTLTATPTSTSTHNIHALIVSGLSDPGSALSRGGPANIILTGGIVALGTTPIVSAAPWPNGLHIVPDPNLIQGNKIPPIVPNLIDVRITDFQTSADFPH